MVRNQRDEPEFQFDSTNFVSDRDFDCNTATTADDAFATFLKDQQDKGRMLGSMVA